MFQYLFHACVTEVERLLHIFMDLFLFFSPGFVFHCSL